MGALVAHVRLAVATGARDAARSSLETMSSIADGTGSTSHRALVDASRGELALAHGDTTEALARLTASWRSWNELGAPYEAATVRVRLAEARLADGDATRARLELEGAAATFERIGASFDARQAQRRLSRLDLGSTAPRRKVRVHGTVARADALRALLGLAAWTDLVTWLDRKLLSCWSEHGGRPVSQADGSYVVEFDDLADAEACVARVRDALQEHRALQGFAPELVVEW